MVVVMRRRFAGVLRLRRAKFAGDRDARPCVSARERRSFVKSDGEDQDLKKKQASAGARDEHARKSFCRQPRLHHEAIDNVFKICESIAREKTQRNFHLLSLN
jgi:hypothetical protein